MEISEKDKQIEEKDGKEFINIYSKSKTELGRFLSNFSHSPFTLMTDGNFNSIEAYWYWLSTKDDSLRPLYGYEAKKQGLKSRKRMEEEGIKLVYDVNFHEKIKEAIKLKIEGNYPMKMQLQRSVLPFVHYTKTSSRGYIQEKQFDWLPKFFEAYRSFLNEGIDS